MENLLLYMLICYYTDLRRLIPSALARKIDSDIRAFADGSKVLTALIVKAKKAANAAKAKARRNPFPRGFSRSKLKNQGKTLVVRNSNPHVQHVPCGGNRTGKPQQKDPEYIPTGSD